jgi:hypothetical protein
MKREGEGEPAKEDIIEPGKVEKEERLDWTGMLANALERGNLADINVAIKSAEEDGIEIDFKNPKIADALQWGINDIYVDIERMEGEEGMEKLMRKDKERIEHLINFAKKHGIDYEVDE